MMGVRKTKKERYRYRVYSLFEGCCGAVSIPGSEDASFRKRAFILNPALADVSMNSTLSLVALSSPSSIDTWRFSARSVLLPTRMMITSDPVGMCVHILNIRWYVYKKQTTVYIEDRYTAHELCINIPRSFRTSSIHLEVFKNEARSKNKNGKKEGKLILIKLHTFTYSHNNTLK